MGAGGSPQLGVHAMAFDVDGLGHSPLTTPPVTTQASGSTFVLFVSYHQLDSVSDNMGNKYSQVGATVAYSTEAGSFVAMYACVACPGGKGHTFSMNKTFPDYGDEGTILAVEVTGASRIDAFAVANSLTNPISAGSVTTTQANDVLLLEATGNSFGSPDQYTPSKGFTLLDENTNGTVSMAGGDAYRIAGAPGSYTGTLNSSQTDPSGGSAAFLIALAQ
jgi:hypothetical protein